MKTEYKIMKGQYWCYVDGQLTFIIEKTPTKGYRIWNESETAILTANGHGVYKNLVACKQAINLLING